MTTNTKPLYPDEPQIVLMDNDYIVEIEDGLLTLVARSTGNCVAIGRGYGFEKGRVTKKWFHQFAKGKDATKVITILLKVCLKADKQQWQPLYKPSAIYLQYKG